MRPQAVLTVLLVMLETFTSSEYSEASGGSSEMTTPTKAEVVGMTTEIRRHREEPQGPGRTEEALLTSSEYSEVLGGSSEMSPTSSVKAEVNGVTSEVGRRREEPQKPGRSKEASLTSSEHSEAVGLPSEAWRRQEDLERSIEPSEASGSEKENLSSEPTVSAARRSPETPATFWRRRQEPQKSSLESDSSPVTSSTFQTPSSESSTKSTLPRTSHQRMKRSSNLQRPRRHRLRLQKDLRRRRRDYDPADDDDDDYDEDMAALARGDDDEELEEEEKQLTWMNPEHPERRPGRFIGEEQTEFVRTEYTDAAYKKLRTYSAGALPRQVECFSCMSLSYQTSWKYLQATYIYPKVFTDRCRDPSSERGMPTVMCSSVCVSLMEPDVEAGVFIGFKHIRGCLDRVLRHGFNQSALRTHRFHQNNQCRTLSRASLFNPARATDPPAIGDVQLCSCYGDRCNSTQTKLYLFSLLLPLITLLFFRSPLGT